VAKLTKLAVDAAKPGKSKPKPGEASVPLRREIPDGKGLYLVVQPNGTKSWAVRYRAPGGTPRKLTIGSVAKYTLTAARAAAANALLEVQHGNDPSRDKATTRAAEKVRNATTVDDAMIVFLQRYRGPKKQGLRESTRNLTAHYFGLKPDGAGEWIKTGNGVLGKWSGRPLASITPADVTKLVEAIDDTGKHVTANRTLTAVKTFFKFCVKRPDIAISVSPAELVDAPAAEESRDRVLSDDEMRAVWCAAGADESPFGRMVQMLLLTGARRDEIREAPFSEFDLDAQTWKLPPERSKNGREHTVPLSSGAVQILRTMPRMHGGLAFTTTGSTPFSGLSKAKRRLDKASGVTGWTLHDLRRTAATGMADKCGALPHVIEAALNHVSGDSKRGVAGIYNRARYWDEMRKTLQDWSDYVHAAPAVSDNVVTLHGARQ
jgi:integrase